MAKTGLAGAALALVLLATACSHEITWEKHVMDGHRTGVKGVIGMEVQEALGIVDEELYYSPSGQVFSTGSTPAVATIMLACQPGMAYLKEVIGTSSEAMVKRGPESTLSNWAVDAVMKGVAQITGCRVDMGVLNMGGIRIDMPKGDVMIDDIVSMFPFRNNLCYVQLAGSDIRYMLEKMVADKIQALGGVRIVVEDRKLVSVEIAGKPLDDNRLYGVATIDFLLDGGDGIYVARNARDLRITDVMVNEWMIPYIKSLRAQGRCIEASVDGRVIVR